MAENHRTSTYEYGNVSIVVHRPVLSEEEEAKRKRRIATALELYGKASYMNQRKEQSK